MRDARIPAAVGGQTECSQSFGSPTIPAVEARSGLGTLTGRGSPAARTLIADETFEIHVTRYGGLCAQVRPGPHTLLRPREIMTCA